jgi:hypothetical protein
MAEKRRGEVSLIAGWSSDLVQLGHAPPAMDRPIDEPSWRCLNLWREIILKALDDAGSTRSDRAAIYRRAARIWLSRPSADRAEVFARAGIDLEAFTTRGLPRLRERWAQVDAEIAAKARASRAQASETASARASGRAVATGAPDAALAA